MAPNDKKDSPSGQAKQTAEPTSSQPPANNEETPQRKEEADRPGRVSRDDPLAGMNLEPGRVQPEEKEEDVTRVQLVDPLPSAQPPAETSAENVAMTPTGEIVDVTVAPPEKMIFNRENNDVAPVPRNQMDQDVSLDPMKRQPGMAPSSVAVQQSEDAAVAEEGEGEAYVMVMPYWDGVQMHDKGTVLRFKPEDAPYGAKLLVKK